MNSYVKLCLSMIIWGTLGLFVLFSGLDYLSIAFYRCLFGAMTILLLTSKTVLNEIKKYSFTDYCMMITSGILIVLNWVFLFKSFQLSSITLGNVSYYTQPIFLILMGIFFFKEKVSRLKWVFILLTFIGVVLTANLTINHTLLHNTIFIGALYALLAGFLYALAAVIVKKLNHVDSMYLTLIQLVSGIFILLPFMNHNPLHFSAHQWSYLLIMGLIHTSLAYLLFYDSLKSLPMTVVAILGYIDPIVAVITDVIFFQQHLQLLQYAGISLTLFGSYYVLNSRKTVSHQHV